MNCDTTFLSPSSTADRNTTKSNPNDYRKTMSRRSSNIRACTRWTAYRFGKRQQHNKERRFHAVHVRNSTRFENKTNRLFPSKSCSSRMSCFGVSSYYPKSTQKACWGVTVLSGAQKNDLKMKTSSRFVAHTVQISIKKPCP